MTDIKEALDVEQKDGDLVEKLPSQKEEKHKDFSTIEIFIIYLKKGPNDFELMAPKQTICSELIRGNPALTNFYIV